MTLNFDLTDGLDLDLSRENIEIAVSQEWEGRLTWNEMDVSWICCWMHNGIDLGPPCMANRTVKYMGQCETLTVSNLLAHEWAIRSLI